MTKHRDNPGDSEEQLRPKLYRDLGRLGWRVPQSEREVRAAEDWVGTHSTRLPDRLHDLSNDSRSTESGRILDRYLGHDGGRCVPEESKSMEGESTDRDLDR
jgi:hypothetical protein